MSGQELYQRYMDLSEDEREQYIQKLSVKDKARLLDIHVDKMPFNDFLAVFNKMSHEQQTKVTKLLSPARKKQLESYLSDQKEITKASPSNPPQKSSGLASIGYGFLATLVVIGGVSLFTNRETCIDVPITYSLQTIDDPTRYVGDDYTLEGHNGTKRVCSKNGKTTSESVTSKAVDTIIYKGTKALSPSPATTSPSTGSNYNISPSPAVRSGAVCNDGTTSTATGRGACSYHGGVRYWL